MHTDGINGLRYLAHNKTVVTSSRDPSASIIIMHIANKLDSYVFKLAWGVRCFDLRQEVTSDKHIDQSEASCLRLECWPRAAMT